MGTEKDSEPSSQAVQRRIQTPVLWGSHLHATFSIFVILHSGVPPLTAGPPGVFVRIRKRHPVLPVGTVLWQGTRFGK